MQYVLLGMEEDATSLVDAFASHPDHKLRAAYDCPVESAPGGVQVRNRDDWESLLHEPGLDCVIVGRRAAEDAHEEQLRKLVQAGVPLIVLHPVCRMLLAFELQMIQRDSGSPIIPFFPGIQHPIFARVRAWIEAPEQSPIGEVRQLLYERGVPTAAAGSGPQSAPVPSRDAVDQTAGPARTAHQPSSEDMSELAWSRFVRDAYTLRQLLGTVDHVSALGTDRTRPVDWHNISVQMSNSDGLLARWSSRRVNGPTAGELTVLADSGKAVCRLTGDVSQWRLEVLEPQSQTVELKPDQSPADTQRQLEAASDGEHDVVGVWDGACRALELVDAASESHRRGKTIDLHHEQVTEEATFKSVMAAGGCLVLLLILLLLPMLATFETLTAAFRDRSADVAGQLAERPGPGGESPFLDPAANSDSREVLPVNPWWPRVLLAALILFLSLQLFRLVFRQPSRCTHTNRT